MLLHDRLHRHRVRVLVHGLAYLDPHGRPGARLVDAFRLDRLGSPGP